MELPTDYSSLATYLRDKSTSELRSLCSDAKKLKSIAENFTETTRKASEKDRILEQCKTTAEANLAMKTQLEELRSGLIADHERLRLKTEEWNMLNAEVDSLKDQTSLDTLQALLLTEAAKTEEETENLAEQYYSKKSDVDTFLENYIQRRALAHKRKVKAEKLGELMRATGRDPRVNAVSQMPRTGSPATFGMGPSVAAAPAYGGPSLSSQQYAGYMPTTAPSYNWSGPVAPGNQWHP